MKALTLKAVSTQINAIVRDSNPEHLQAVFVNAVYHGLIHGNIMPTAMKALRNSEAPSKLKAAINKYMPMKWNKAKARYEFNTAKRDKLHGELNVNSDTTLEALAEALPTELFAKAPRKQTEYNRAEYLANVAKKLEKEGEPQVEAIIGLMAALLETPELTKAAAQAVFKASKAVAKAA